jgi:carboxypeptidase Taq
MSVGLSARPLLLSVAMSDPWDRLVTKLQEMADLARTAALMQWDQAVMMPPGGAPSRARGQATIEAITHARLTDPEVGDILGDLEDDPDLDADKKASLRILRHDYDRATKVPSDLVKEIAEVQGHSYQAWTEARPADDFSILEPHLDKLFRLKREEADALGFEGERYDALLDAFEPGMTADEVARMFDELVAGLRPLNDAVLGVERPAPEWLFAEYDEPTQHEICHWLVEHLNFDTERGRLDASPHPFTMGLVPSDVRQTTRAEKNNFLGSVYAAIHETGHALYEQGLPAEYVDLPVGRAPSLGMHESQSRMWENHVGRSREFAGFLLPVLKERWPQLGMISPEEFYAGINYAQRSLIRVNADELTYNLHVAVRFDLERALLRDDLNVSELPDVWDDAYERTVGIRSPNQADGVLQDMHWSIGAIGYFPTYSLGNIYSAALFDKAEAEIDGLRQGLAEGETRPLLEWLRENIHSEGYRYDARTLAEKVVGGSVTAAPLLNYLRTKYSELYEVTV